MQMPPELPTYNPYAAPVSRLEDFPTHVLHLATRISRLGAYLLDLFSIGLLGIVAAIILPSFAKSGGSAESVGIAVVVIAMLAVWVVHIVFLYKYGQTIGKRLVGIKVVQMDGRRCELWRFFVLRYFVPSLFGAIPIVGPLVTIIGWLMIFGQEQRCLHDLIANTIVVQV